MRRAGFRALLADGAKLGAPLAVTAVEQEQRVARLEFEHVSEVMRLVLRQRNRRPLGKRGRDEEALELR